MSTKYLQLIPGGELPDISALRPFLGVIVSEETVSSEWRDTTSKWIVQSGCIYLMAWGENCEEWEDSVDLANIQQFNHGDIPEDELVVTTCREGQTLEEVFRESKNSTSHSCVEFANTLILHISAKNKENEFLPLYSRA